MNVQAEISLYPLRTPAVGEAIDRFLDTLEASGIDVHASAMSSRATGEVGDLFEGLGQAFETVAESRDIVLVLKVSNACPAEAKH